VTEILFLPFAVSEGGAGEVVAHHAIARQLPRLLAELIDGRQGYSCQFLPMVGGRSGKRGFVTFRDMLGADQIPLFTDARPDLLVEGRIGDGKAEVFVSAVSPEPGRSVIQHRTRLAFDPEDPRILYMRLILELWDALDLRERPIPPPEMPAEAFRLYLAGIDEELALAANLTQEPDQSPFAPLLRALELAPGSPVILDAMLSMARLHIEQRRGDVDHAAAALAKSLEHGSCDKRYVEEAARLARFTKNREAVEALVAKHVESSPEDYELSLALASTWLRAGREAEAIDVLEASAAVFDEVPPNVGPKILALLLQHSLAYGDREAAARWAERLRTVDTLPVDAAEILIRWASDESRPDAAREARRRVPEAEHSSQVDLELARALLVGDQTERAKEQLLALQNDRDARIRGEAERLLRFVEDPEVLRLLEQADSDLRGKNARAALRWAKAAVKRQPNLAETHFVLGLVRSALGQPRRAIRALRRALSLDCDLIEARNRLGILLVSIGRHREAYEQLQRVLQQRADQLGPLLHMAQACHYLGRNDEGLGHLERAEQLFPDHPMVRETRNTFFAQP